MAVAADNGGRFGGGESTLTARLPLQIRPSPPRFANYGDRFELPVVVQNQTDQEMVADVVAETSNLTLTDAHGLRVKVPANDRVEVRFPVEDRRRGHGSLSDQRDARRRCRQRNGRVPRVHAGHDRSLRDLRRGRRRRHRAARANPDRGRAPVRRPRDRHVVDRDAGPHRRGRLPRRLSRTRAPTRTRRGSSRSRRCATCSRPSVVPECRPRRRSTRASTSDIKALTALQNDDGGFSTWTRGGDPQPYISVQATEALVLARLAGFAVPETSVQSCARVRTRHRIEVPAPSGARRTVTR